MSAKPEPGSVPPQIPVKLERYDTNAQPQRRYWFHPKSGLLILGVDWLFFAPEAVTAELGAIITSPLAFIIVTTGVFLIQRKRNGDSLGAAMIKALIGGVLAGIPTPISGTVFGTLVLLLSGLSSWNRRGK